jgi:hypothetical protein
VRALEICVVRGLLIEKYTNFKWLGVQQVHHYLYTEGEKKTRKIE